MKDVIDFSKISFSRTITFEVEDRALYEQTLRGLPTYSVRWIPPNITAMTWPG